MSGARPVTACRACGGRLGLTFCDLGAMAVATVLSLTLPMVSRFFDLDMPPTSTWWALLAVVAAGWIAIHFVPVHTDRNDEEPLVGPADGAGTDGEVAPVTGG